MRGHLCLLVSVIHVRCVSAPGGLLCRRLSASVVVVYFRCVSAPGGLLCRRRSVSVVVR